jgi:hypothetical protein
MNMPAAMTRIAITIPKPAIAGINVAKPVRISQMANNRKPILFVNLILISLSYFTTWGRA